MSNNIKNVAEPAAYSTKVTQRYTEKPASWLNRFFRFNPAGNLAKKIDAVLWEKTLSRKEGEHPPILWGLCRNSYFPKMHNK